MLYFKHLQRILAIYNLDIKTKETFLSIKTLKANDIYLSSSQISFSLPHLSCYNLQQLIMLLKPPFL